MKAMGGQQKTGIEETGRPGSRFRRLETSVPALFPDFGKSAGPLARVAFRFTT
jgi:hypothetical protein